jgi:hypothetical protein
VPVIRDDDERLARIERLLRELRQHTAETQEEVLIVTEQLLEQARKNHAEAMNNYQQGKAALAESRAKRKR